MENELISDSLSLAGEMASLNVVDCLTHVTVGNEEQSAESLLSDFDALALYHSLQVEFHLAVA